MLSKKWQTAADRSLQRHRVADGFCRHRKLNFRPDRRKNAHVLWTFRGVGAILYLVVCGSWIGYTAYIWLLQHVPTSKVSTYAYVNPVVALFLGWLVLHERIDRYILMGSAIIVASVVLVTSAKVSSAPRRKSFLRSKPRRLTSRPAIAPPQLIAFTSTAFCRCATVFDALPIVRRPRTNSTNYR